MTKGPIRSLASWAITAGGISAGEDIVELSTGRSGLLAQIFARFSRQLKSESAGGGEGGGCGT